VNTNESIGNKVAVLTRIMSALGVELKDNQLDTRIKRVTDDEKE